MRRCPGPPASDRLRWLGNSQVAVKRCLVVALRPCRDVGVAWDRFSGLEKQRDGPVEAVFAVSGGVAGAVLVVCLRLTLRLGGHWYYRSHMLWNHG